MASKTLQHKPHQLLAKALSQAKAVSRDGVIMAIDLDRSTKETLIAAGCLTEIIKGWYLLTSPLSESQILDQSTIWYGGCWAFLSYYLQERFGKNGYCFSAESSMDIHAGETTISQQWTVLTRETSNHVIQLPQQSSLFLYADKSNFPPEFDRKNGLNIMPLPQALVRLPPSYYTHKPLNIELVLRSFSAIPEISRTLLETQAVTAANRIVGAYTALKEASRASQISEDLSAAGFTLKPINPFATYTPTLNSGLNSKSPYSGRIETLWNQMRPAVIKIFPRPPGLSKSLRKTIHTIEGIYTQDAYHSLSIEGYQVTEALIEKIALGNWNPADDLFDRDQRNALAAKGYYDTFQAVLTSIEKVFKKQESGEIFQDDLQNWYRKLFQPSAQAGLIKAGDLAGYRNSQVYIRGSRHVPPSSQALMDTMDTLFKLLQQEKHPGVRAVLGHFIFVYIHPYMDGNGRIGRFLMNLMLISGGYPWTILRVERRQEYMAALEQASVHKNILPFTRFIMSEMKISRGLGKK